MNSGYTFRFAEELFSSFSLILGCLVLLGSGAFLWCKGVTKKNLLILTFRIVSLVLLFLSVHGPRLEETSEQVTVTGLLDVSDSMDRELGDEMLRAANKFQEPTVILEMLPFAGSKGSIPLEEASDYGKIRNAWGGLDIGRTNLSVAIGDAISSGARNILLLSDGRETEANLREQIPSLLQRGVKIYPIIPDGYGEVTQGMFRVLRVHAPLTSPAEKSVDIRVTVENTTTEKRSGLLEVFHDTKKILSKRIQVPSGGEDVYVAESDPSQEGIKEIKATLTPDSNDAAPSSEVAFLSGVARERVLLLSGSAADERMLREVLEAQKYQLDAIVPTDRVEPDLSKYSVVIMNNIHRDQLTRGELSAMQRFAGNGGGVIMVGGNRSFGLGGYIGTPIEDILPVRLIPPHKEEKRLNVAVELVLDKSRSMSTSSRIEFAKEAARGVVNLLKNEDYVGIVGFDSVPFVLLPLKQLTEIRARALERINILAATGNTNLLPAIEEARRSLSRVSAGRKHMIVLTDGQVPDSGPIYLEVVKQMHILGITTSTVLIGDDDDGLLKSMAEYGGGKFYQTSDPRSLPKIFLSDVKVASGERTMKEERDYTVRKGPGTLRTTTLENFPPIRGYVTTERKEDANLELVSVGEERAEPLLASWKYKGEGKVVAFTSDANGRWSNQWIEWSRFAQFWSEVVDSTRRQQGKGEENVPFDLRYYVEGGNLVFDTSVFSEEVSGSMVAEVALPDGSVRTIPFATLLKGRYRGELPGVKAGKYIVKASIGERKLTPIAFGLSGELFGERKGLGVNTQFLRFLADETGGKLNPTPEELASDGEKKTTIHDVTTPFLGLALLLIILEILAREVRIPRFRSLALSRR